MALALVREAVVRPFTDQAELGGCPRFKYSATRALRRAAKPQFTCHRMHQARLAQQFRRRGFLLKRLDFETFQGVSGPCIVRVAGFRRIFDSDAPIFEKEKDCIQRCLIIEGRPPR
jgi:hypothetical protein